MPCILKERYHTLNAKYRIRQTRCLLTMTPKCVIFRNLKSSRKINLCERFDERGGWAFFTINLQLPLSYFILDPMCACQNYGTCGFRIQKEKVSKFPKKGKFLFLLSNCTFFKKSISVFFYVKCNFTGIYYVGYCSTCKQSFTQKNLLYFW